MKKVFIALIISILSVAIFISCGGGGGGSSSADGSAKSEDENPTDDVASDPITTNAASILSFSPTYSMVAPGQDFTVDAMIDPNNTNHVSAIELHITYDPAIISINSILPSSNFPNVLINPSIPNPQNGTASIHCGALPSSSSVSSPSAIATISFHALTATDSSCITFTYSSAAAADGEQEDVIAGTKPVLVVVNSGS